MKDLTTSKPSIQHHNNIKKTQEGRPSTETSEEPMMTGNGTHQVIRTKAVRCTKVFLPPNQGDPPCNKDMEPCDNEIPPLLTPQEDDCLNFLMDFGLSETFVSDILDNDDMHAFGDEIQEKINVNGGDEGGHNLSSSFEEQFSFSEAVLDDWRESNSLQDGVGLELEFLDLPLIIKEAC